MTIQPFIALVDQILATNKQPPQSPFNKGELKDADTSLPVRDSTQTGVLERQIDKGIEKGIGGIEGRFPYFQNL